jgi:hypothetical protein
VATQVWIVRAGKDDEYEAVSFAESVVAIGWRQVGDLTAHRSMDSIRRITAEAYPNVQMRTRNAYAPQLYALRTSMRKGDLVILLRSRAPEVAIGEVTGDYRFRPDLPGRHTRPVQWHRRTVRLGEIGADLVTAPALTAIYRVTRLDAVERLRAVARTPDPADGAATGEATVDDDVVDPAGVDDATTDGAQAAETMGSAAARNLRRNLSYARNLATAGSHLERLGVTGFEVRDVYRAAWVQAVAALDHWVRQEVHERVLAMVDDPAKSKPDGYRRFALPLQAVEDVQAGRLTLRAAVDAHLKADLAYATYQNPDKIREGLKMVAEVSNLWTRVAAVLSERADNFPATSGNEVKKRLADVVTRRNKIAHEYDEDPERSPAKRAIDAASTMSTIDLIDQMVAAIIIVLDQE